MEKTFPLNDAGELQLENKYGDIALKGWDQNKVSIKMTIKVNHRKRDNAKDLLSRVDPEIKSSGNYVTITSKISNKNTGWFADFFNRANPIDLDRSHVKIDYEVFLPRKTKLKVTNRFGDVFIEGWQGKLTALIEHGDLWLGEDLSKASIILKFGKIKARNLNYASINLKNGELDMKDGKSLRLTSDGADLSIGIIKALELYSNKDHITLQEVGTVYGNIKFSAVTITKLLGDTDLTMKIADLKVMQIAAPAMEINIEQESSDINLMVAGFSHRFEATLEQGVVRLPKPFENVNSNILDKGRKLRKISATYGKNQTGSINIFGIKGIVTLRE
ncbi:MAG: hypothetical protein AAGF77_07930 [Bacteroidota bacterium]